jgi:arsenate reductase
MTDRIYHNPECETSRNTLGLIRNAGIDPVVVEYLKHPPTPAVLFDLIQHAGLSVRDAIRQMGTPYLDLGLDDPTLTDEQLLQAMCADPILINRPFVATTAGVRPCRPSELVLEILDQPQRSAFAKEDGEPVIDEKGFHIRPG